MDQSRRVVWWEVNGVANTKKMVEKVASLGKCACKSSIHWLRQRTPSREYHSVCV